MVVLVMFKLHHDDNIDEDTGDKRKPEMITFYNSTKAGVDVVDEMCRENQKKEVKRTEFIRNLGLGLVNEWLHLRKEKKNLP